MGLTEQKRKYLEKLSDENGIILQISIINTIMYKYEIYT